MEEKKNEINAFAFRFVNGIGFWVGTEHYEDRNDFIVRILFMEFAWIKFFVDDNDADDFINGATGGI